MLARHALGEARRQMRRGRRRGTLVLAARLRGELLQKLDRLEDRHWSLRGHIEGVQRSGGGGRRDALFGRDLPDGLHAGTVVFLRDRVEETYRGLGRLKGAQLEDRCRGLAGLRTELAALVAEIEEREAAWGLGPRARPPWPRVARTAPPGSRSAPHAPARSRGSVPHAGALG